MTPADLFQNERFPRAGHYNPEWLMNSMSSGTNWLWLAEWLSQALDLQPGMRVLDLGCGRAASSIFFAREFGVQVWAYDLWFSASENFQRIKDAGMDARVFPIHGDARVLPFPAEYFDVITSVDSYMYYGTDDLYLQGLARFLKPNGQLGMAGAGLTREFDGAVPEHLQQLWAEECPCFFHSAEWWRNHWAKTGLVDIQSAETMPDGWRYWLDWQNHVAPENHTEIAAVTADRGAWLGYHRVVARRKAGRPLPEAVTSVPYSYTAAPLLRPPPTQS